MQRRYRLLQERAALWTTAIYASLVMGVAAQAPGLSLHVTGLRDSERWTTERTGVVSSGIPIAKGVCKDVSDIRLHGPDGTSVPVQTSVLSSWPDGSVRWALLTFEKGIPAGYAVTFGGPAVQFPDVIEVEEAGGRLDLDTGSVRLAFHDQQQGLWESLEVKRGGRWIRPFASDPVLAVHTENGEILPVLPVVSRYTLEERGPFRAVVKVEPARSPEEGDIRYFARIYCCAGKPWMRVDLTFINCTDPGDTAYRNEVLRPERGVRAVTSIPLSFSMGSAMAEGPVQAGAEGAEPLVFDAPRMWVAQTADSEYAYSSGGTTTTVRGRLAGWAKVGAFAAGCREFWQQFPKSFAYDADTREFCLDLCPTPGDQPWQLNPGVSKTHQLVFDFDSGQGLDQVLHPMQAVLTPEDTLASGAITPFGLEDKENWLLYEQMVDFSYHYWETRAPNKKWPGILHYGDPAGNGYHHPDHDLMLHYFRSGDGAIYRCASAESRHRADIDITHYPEHLRGQHHTEYSKDHWDPRSGTIKEWIAGLCDYYCTTGDRRALDALNNVGAWFLRCKHRFPERNSALPLGWLTRLVWITDNPAYREEMEALYEYLREIALKDGYEGRTFSVGHLVDGFYLYFKLTGDEEVVPLIEQVCRWFYEETGMPSGMFPAVYYWSPGEVTSVGAQAYELTGNREYLDYALAPFDSYINWYAPMSYTGWYLGPGAGMHQAQWACQQEGLGQDDVHVAPWAGFDRAIAALRDMLGKDYDYDSLTVELARTLTNAGRYEEAVEALDERLAVKNGKDRFRMELLHAKAYVRYRQGDYEGALEAYQALAEFLGDAGSPEVSVAGPQMSCAWMIGAIAERLGKKETAIEAYRYIAKYRKSGRREDARARLVALGVTP